MSTVILAVGDASLRGLCEGALARAGHITVRLDRALQLLDLETRLRGDVVMVDDSALGRDVVRAGAVAFANRFVGLGLAAPGVALLTLPLEAGRRVARANGREVALTRTEYQLLEALLSRRGHELLLDEAMEAIWGAGEWSGNIGLLRAHMRNLRLKLGQIGLNNAVRSRRARGYALAL